MRSGALGTVVCSSCGQGSAAFMRTCSSCGSSLQVADRTGPPRQQAPGFSLRAGNISQSVLDSLEYDAHQQSPSQPQSSFRLPLQGRSEDRLVAPALFPSDGRFTEENVAELRRMISEATVYSQQVASSVIALEQQISQKQTEIERIKKTRASGGGGGSSATFARAKQEREADAVVTTPQMVEYLALRQQLESIRNEQAQMQVDVAALRALVAELHPATTAATASAVPHPDGGDDGTAGGGSGTATRRLRVNPATHEILTSPTASWNIGRAAVTNSEQRDLIACLQYLPAADAKPLQQGTLHFLRVLARRLVLPLPNGTRPDIGICTGEVLRLLRSGHDLAAEAMLPIPTAEMTITEKIVSLFLANNTFSYGELQQLLAKYENREEELYKILQKEYSDSTGKYVEEQRHFAAGEEPLWAPAPAPSFRQSQLAKMGTSQITPINKTVSIDQREMHARCVIMYKKYNPAKANSRDFSEMLKKYTPEVILDALVEKYGPEPSVAERRQLIKDMFAAQGSQQTPTGGGGPAISAALASGPSEA
jgi:hypothetical protein